MQEWLDDTSTIDIIIALIISANMLHLFEAGCSDLSLVSI